MNGIVARWRATRKGFKPRDVEEWIDFHWHRPLAGLLVQVLLPTRITPNQVTFISGGFSLLTGGALALAAWHHRGWAVLAGFFLLASIVFDCADGQLARLRGSSSPLGRILDGAMDAVAPATVYFGQVAVLLNGGSDPLWSWVIGWSSAFSLIWHASAYDVGKNIYLHCSRPDFSLGGATLLSVEDMRTLRDEQAAAGNRVGSFLMRIWMGWTAPQMRSMSPWLEAQRCPQNDAERELYLEYFRPRMKRLAWMGFGTHLFVLTLACWVAAWEPRAIWVAWLIILVPLNIVALSLSLTQSSREQAFVEALAKLRAQASAA